MKKCNRCGLEKPLLEFYKDKWKKSGIKDICKKCHNSNRDRRRSRKIKEDPEYRKKINRKKATRLNKNPIFKYRKSMASMLRRDIKSGYNNGTLSHRVLGVDFETMKSHLESLFVEGMSWDNFGEWHLDHIIPLSLAKTKEEVLKLLHYTNVQPLWAKDNIDKANKIPEGYQIPF